MHAPHSTFYNANFHQFIPFRPHSSSVISPSCYRCCCSAAGAEDAWVTARNAVRSARLVMINPGLGACQYYSCVGHQDRVRRCRHSMRGPSWQRRLPRAAESSPAVLGSSSPSSSMCSSQRCPLLAEGATPAAKLVNCALTSSSSIPQSPNCVQYDRPHHAPPPLASPAARHRGRRRRRRPTPIAPPPAACREFVLRSVNSAAVLAAVFTWGATPRPGNLGVQDYGGGLQTLGLCPPSPNCISTAEVCAVLCRRSAALPRGAGLHCYCTGAGGGGGLGEGGRFSVGGALPPAPICGAAAEAAAEPCARSARWPALAGDVLFLLVGGTATAHSTHSTHSVFIARVSCSCPAPPLAPAGGQRPRALRAPVVGSGVWWWWW